jgi:tRNA nucleotidyltransferase (CCA-adding enzyme)
VKEMDENEEMEGSLNLMDIDPMNKQRNIKNILSKRKLSRFELDEIFAQ